MKINWFSLIYMTVNCSVCMECCSWHYTR